MVRHRRRPALIALIVAAALTGCGIKGPLTVPPKPEPPKADAPAAEAPKKP